MNKTIYLNEIAELLDKYYDQDFENDDGTGVYDVECEITFVREDGIAERFVYVGGEFEMINHQ